MATKPPAPDDDLFADIAAHLRAQRAAPPPGRVRLEVLEVIAGTHGAVVTARVLAGTPRPGMRLVAAGTGERWEVRSAGVAQHGRWALALTPLGHAGTLSVGMVLHAD